MTTVNAEHRAYGEELQKRLVDVEMSRKELAERVGIDPRRISDIIKGIRPFYKIRDKIAEVLDLAEQEVAV